MNSLLSKYAPFKKLVNINSNLQQNLGLRLVYKTQSLLRTNYSRNSSIKRIQNTKINTKYKILSK